METSNIQIITLTTPNQPESASSASHNLTTTNPTINSFSDANPVNSDSDNTNSSATIKKDTDKCKKKKFKLSEITKSISKTKPHGEKLEDRLYNVLCCAVCLELPSHSIYQCNQGHLICLSCFNHILADARLKNEEATCASCRCSITKENCMRNLAVEKAIGEMPGKCQHCNKKCPRAILATHELYSCIERPTFCCFKKIGCPWKGPFNQQLKHEMDCLYPKKSAKEVFYFLQKVDGQEKEDINLFLTLINLLSFDKIVFTDLRLNFSRTDEYIQRLFYETQKFIAFNCNWVVKARVNDDQKDPTQSCERKFSYQLVLKTKISTPLVVHFLIVQGFNKDMKIKPKIYCYEFSDSKMESPYMWMPLFNTAECNKLLACKFINFRIIMFQTSK